MEDIGLGESSSLTEETKFASVFFSAECAPENLPQRVFLAHCCSSLLIVIANRTIGGWEIALGKIT